MFRVVRTFFHNNLLLFIVFLTGAAVLIIEITATRLLSVYFGNTIYTVSSIISVVLLALSLGYFMGGRLADKKGTEFLFYQVIALSGLSVFLLHLLNMYIVPQISTDFSLREGPLVSSLILFLLPGILLGMLSPIVAKLQKVRLKKQGIGQITGDVFFWSTLGSIAGSLGTGFYLIPNYGISEIIVGTGAALFLLGLIGMLIPRRQGTSGGIFIVLLLTLPLLHLALVSFNDRKEHASVVHRQEGVYDNIVIYDNEYYGVQARFLQQSLDASSAMYLNSDQLVYDYTKYYEVYKLVTSNPENALVIGGGAYSVPKALLQDEPDIKVDVAEIEPDLFALGQKYFNVPKDARLTNYVEDGRRLLRDKDTSYDLIFSDAYHFSIPAHLTTKEFFELSKSKLKPEGVFVANVIGSLDEKQPSFLFSEIKTFKTVFPNSYFFAVDSLEAEYPQNIIMVGYNGDAGRNLLSVDTNEPFLSTLSTKLIDLDKYDLSPHPLLTDDYAPVEYFISQRLTQESE
jgi:spermidine synthase